MKLSLLSLLVVLSVALGGCSLVPGIHFGVEVNVNALDDEQRVRTQRAADRWNAVTDEDHKITLSVDDGLPILVVPQPEIPTPIKSATGLYTERAIYVADSLEGDSFEMVVGHELGHAIGILWHHDGVGLMRVNGGQLELSEDDLRECRKAGACD